MKQESLLVEKPKEITFEELCPKWNKVVEEIAERKSSFIDADALAAEKGLDYVDHARCFVGEAHGFKDDYNQPDSPGFCNECCNLAVLGNFDMFGMVGQGGLYREAFEESKQKLVDHFNEVHVK